jgi:Fe-S cluster biogenesis protein NfuA
MSTITKEKFDSLPVEERIELVLYEMDDYLKSHYGGITFVDFVEETGDVQVYMEGACAGCGIQAITLQKGILQRLTQLIPEVKSITPVMGQF